MGIGMPGPGVEFFLVGANLEDFDETSSGGWAVEENFVI